MRFYVEELEGLFEDLSEYYKSLLRLEEKLRLIAGGESDNLVDIMRWRLSIARLLVEHRRLIEAIKRGVYVEARTEACIVHDITSKVMRGVPDESIVLYILPVLAGIYEISRSICDGLGS